MRTDEELMAAHARGEPGAYEELFRRYSGLVTNFMRKDLWRPEDAHDLAQQTFLQLHRARRDFDPAGNLRSWLLTIARNLKYDYMRRAQRRVKTTPLDTFEPSAESAHPRRVEARDLVENALAALPESQSAVIRLYWLEGLPHAEVARRLGVSEAAVRVRAHRAYKALREILSPDPGDAP